MQLTCLSLGLMLSSSGLAASDPHHLSLLYWQAPSILNPYLSGGIKDVESSSVVIEPLAWFGPDGQMVPVLAESIPNKENGGISSDSKTITWKLKKGLLWSDGSPVTSKDVAFTAKYCTDPNGGCAQLNVFDDIEKIETPDDRTVKIYFSKPVYYPYKAFVSAQSPIIQAKQFANCLGAKASQCTKENFSPVGTGPFRVKTFRTNDTVEYEANPNFREMGKPHFKTMTIKGGGSAADAARAVYETGEADFAWNLQIPPEVLSSMESKGIGRTEVAFGSAVERLMLNMTNPSPDLGESRSTVKHPHPFLNDASVRKALSMAIDRQILNEMGYGAAGRPTCEVVPSPDIYSLKNKDCLKQDIPGANALLDKAGWKKGVDGIREKNGVKLKILYQTSVNPIRQDFQAIIKEWWKSIGVETELKSINASVFFGGDAASPDTLQKFYADIQMYTNLFPGTDPSTYVSNWLCGNEPRPSTQWQGINIPRFCSKAYDGLVSKLMTTASIADRAAIVKQIEAMLTSQGHVIIPLVQRGRVSGFSNTVKGAVGNALDSELWNVKDWRRG